MNTTPDPAEKQLPLFDPIEIPLTQGYVALVDPIDADLLQISWYAWKNRNRVYAHSQPQDRRKARTKMHRVIMSRVLGRDLTSSEFVDHRKGIGLDNRRENLRLATVSENGQNRTKQSNNTSGYKGVSWSKHSSKWEAKIRANGRLIYLGKFVAIDDAYAAYCEAAIKYHGEFARFDDAPGGGK